MHAIVKFDLSTAGFLLSSMQSRTMHAIVEIGLITAGFLLSSLHLCIGHNLTLVLFLPFSLSVFCSLT